MPVGQTYDFMLNNNGYMLARPGNGLARAWQRSGVPDTPSIEQPRVAGEFGGLPSQVEYPEVWNDWSGGYGHAYRHPKDENSYFGFLANPNLYHWSENFDARFPRQLVHAQKLRPITNLATNGVNNGVLLDLSYDYIDVPPVSVNTPKVGQGNVLIGGNTAVYILSPRSDGSLDVIPTPPGLNNDGVAHIGRLGIFGSYVYIGNSDATGFHRFGFDATVTQASFFGVHFLNSGDRMWRSFGDNYLHSFRVQNLADFSGSGALNASSWSATLNLATGQHYISDWLTLEGQVYVGMADGLYAGDASGTFVNVLPQLAQWADRWNATNMTIHNGQVMVPHVGGIIAYTPSADTARAEEIGPLALVANRGPAYGRIRCVRGYAGWLYAGMYTGSYNWLLAGIPDSNNNGQYTWHTLQKYMGDGYRSIHNIYFDSITVASDASRIPVRMWVANEYTAVPSGNTGSANPYYCCIPLANGNPLVPDPAFTPNFANSARMDFGSTDGRAPTTPKVYRSCEVWADNLDGSQRWGLVYYTIDGGARTLLGTVNVSPKSVLFFPNAQGSFVNGQSIELSLESYIAAGAEATSPVYRSVVLRQTQVPRSVDMITAMVDVGDNMVDRQGSTMRSGAVQLAELRGLVATIPTQLVDLTGATWWVKVLAPVEEQEAWQEGMINPSVLATVKMAVMSFTSN